MGTNVTKWLKKLLGAKPPTNVRRFEVVYREQLYATTKEEAVRHVLDKLRNQHVEFMVKQFTSKADEDDKAILTFVKTESVFETSKK